MHVKPDLLWVPTTHQKNTHTHMGSQDVSIASKIWAKQPIMTKLGKKSKWCQFYGDESHGTKLKRSPETNPSKVY